MKKYKLHFYARKLGALGIKSEFTETVEADDLEEARLKLYDKYEHISNLRVFKPLSEIHSMEISVGTRVVTASGKTGSVAYVRLDYRAATYTPEAVSVILDEKRDKPGYSGSMYAAKDVFYEDKL